MSLDIDADLPEQASYAHPDRSPKEPRHRHYSSGSQKGYGLL